MWVRHGNVFAAGRAQLPTLCQFNGRSFVSFSKRNDAGFSYGCLKEYVFAGDKIKFQGSEKIIIKPGNIGSTDCAGTMPMQIINDKLFYIGWTLRQDVPYFNYSSVAKWNGSGFVKLGPILSPDVIDSGYSGTLHVFKTKSLKEFYGIYLSSTDWVKDEHGIPQPCYDLKLATSRDLVKWHKTGKVMIKLETNEAGISSACVIEHQGILHMWFSVRGGQNFRERSSNSYKVKHAFSIDGLNWKRSGLFGLEADPVLGENMVAYPSVVIHRSKIHMLYNGLSFGLGGISHASLELKELTIAKARFQQMLLSM